MAHLVPDLRHRVVVRRDLAVRRSLGELVRVRHHVVGVAVHDAFRRILGHLIRADVHRLDVLPLETSLRAVVREVPLVGADSGHRAARRTAAQGA